MTAFVANSNVLDLVGLRNEIAGTYMNAATVEVTILDSADVEVAGQVWPTAMSYVAASNGDYRAIISEDVAFLANKKYTAVIDADGGPGLVGHWEFEFQARTRTGLNED